MSKELTHSFSIKLAKLNKAIKKSSNLKKVGRKCVAVVVKDYDILKARISFDNNGQIEYIVLPFTDESLDLKGKEYVFAKERDKYGKLICIIRSKLKATLYYGTSDKYDVLKEGLLISGHIYEKDNKKYFNYEELLAFTENGARLYTENGLI